jgi:hypothetical protein
MWWSSRLRAPLDRKNFGGKIEEFLNEMRV